MRKSETPTFFAVMALVTVAAMLVFLAFASVASADFGLKEFEVSFSDENGAPVTQAGAHPFAMDTLLEFNHSIQEGKLLPDGGDIRDTVLEQTKGFVGSATAVPRCSTLDFVTEKPPPSVNVPSCPDATAVGVTAVLFNNPEEALPAAVYNLTPPPGVPARLGFVIEKVPVTIDVGVKPRPDHNILAHISNAAQAVTVFGALTQLWGVPGDPAHDFARGQECAFTAFKSGNPTEIILGGELNLRDPETVPDNEKCPSEGGGETPLLTLPRACEGPLATGYEVFSWPPPGFLAKGAHLTPPFEGCGKLEFIPGISSKATTDSAETGSGLDFELDFEDPVDHVGEGLIEAGGIAAVGPEEGPSSPCPRG